MVSKTKKSGTYCLIIQLTKNSNIKVGKLGILELKAGYYVYIGSALNSLKSRVNRHLSREKKLFWHVDYLLNSGNAYLKDVIYVESEEKLECIVASKIGILGTLINKFGCSDCKCKSHLIYFKEFQEAKDICSNTFKTLNLNPKELSEFLAS
ncbi:MAG: GIY-YIG nuclease family protein [Methanomicrobiales archaeon]